MDDKKNSSNGSFKKVIGLFGGISLVAGMTIGSGVYYLGSYVLERTDFSMGWAIFCWILGGIISMMGGLCFAELGASRPVAGGMTIYLSEAYHPVFGFINGFSNFIVIASGSIAALALAAITAFKGLLGLSEIQMKIIAIAIIVAFTALNLAGAKFGVIVQNISMVLRIIPLILVIVLGFAFGSQNPELSLSVKGTRAEGNGIAGIISMVGYATFASLWAYEGWTNLNTVAEEMKKPKRDLPLSIIISIGIITLLYTLFQLAIYKVLPHDQIESMIGEGNIYLGQVVAKDVMGNMGHILVLGGMTVGILGTINGDVLVFPRTYYAMSKEGYFPKAFSNISKRTGVPVEATLASSGIAIILVIFNTLQGLTNLLVFLSALLNCMVIGAVLIYRKKYPDLERPYKVWGGKVTVIITLIFFFILLVNQLLSDPKNSLIGLIIPAIGILVYIFFRKKNGGEEYKGEGIE